MPSIEIFERDLTSGGGRNTNFNVVYIPGFMSNDISTDDKTTPMTATGAWPVVAKKTPTTVEGETTVTTTYVVDVTTAATARTPILCESISDFEKYFGTKPAVFNKGEGTRKVDLSYIYAKELLKLGLPVLYESMNGLSNGAITAPVASGKTPEEVISEAISSTTDGLFGKLGDKGEYQFKYLTTGGYPICEVDATSHESINVTNAKVMAKLAFKRGDCIALLDYTNDADVDLSELYKDIITKVKDMDGADQCAIFTPWVNVDCTTYKATKDEKEGNTFTMPPSFAYLTALAKSIRTNASWLAVAGATRGQIPNLNGKEPLVNVLSNSVAESFQNRDGISINAITNIKPFGYRIWGNRTLKDNSYEGNLTATSFLNIRNLICDVKKVVYEACRKYTFEQNNDVLWLNFKSYIEPTLNQMKTGAGLSGYKIVKGETTEKAKLVAQIKLYPLYAVEDFTVEVQMLDDKIAVS